MDRRWVHSRLFSHEYIDGVKEFMSFIQGKFNEDVEILCPCSRCLNQKYQRQTIVKKHILMNGVVCAEQLCQVEDYVNLFREELETQGVTNIERMLRQGFQTWFRNHKYNTNPEEVDVDIFSLACGPDLRVRKYSLCIVNGVRFNTFNRDKNKKTQNNGLMSQATHNGQLIGFFGNIKEIIQLDYNLEERSVVLFKCDWFKLDGKRTALKDDGFFRSVNVGSLWYKNDCFILATHATKVFYLPDTRLGENWQVVQTFDHRHLYNVSQTKVNVAAYQEDKCYDDEGLRQPVSNIIYDKPLNRDDERGPVFEAAEIARLMKESSKEVNIIGDEDEEDDTLMEYYNEEDEILMEVDSDDE